MRCRLDRVARTGIGVRPENRCTARVKATGARCRAAKVTLKRVDPGHEGEVTRYRVCLGHLMALSDHDQLHERHGFRPNSTGGGRPPKPSAIEVLRHKVEQEYGIDAVLKPYFEALTKANLFATYQGEVNVSPHPDVGARIEAAEKLLDRVYGKPKQTTEVSGPGGGPVTVDVPNADERQAAIAELLRRAGAVDEPKLWEPEGSSNGRNGGSH